MAAMESVVCFALVRFSDTLGRSTAYATLETRLTLPVRTCGIGALGIGYWDIGQGHWGIGALGHWGIGALGHWGIGASAHLHVERVLVHVPARRLGGRDDDLLLQEELLRPRAHHGAVLVARRDDSVGRGVHHLEVVGMGDGLVSLLQHRGRRHPPVRRRDHLAIGADALARVEVDRARVHGVAVAPRDRVLELDLEGVEGHQWHLIDVEVADVDGEFLRRRRVAEGLGGAIVAPG
eukprot:scaffold33809_cov42-Phaeocystis_antarctica.AAC.1